MSLKSTQKKREGQQKVSIIEKKGKVKVGDNKQLKVGVCGLLHDTGFMVPIDFAFLQRFLCQQVYPYQAMPVRPLLDENVPLSKYGSYGKRTLWNPEPKNV
ncbi:hypothetical protein PoB_002019100 [Plakobranchus ocellatus]|uniref:Uncharacterized protein n=1 Tax=Plakobranchus ocellatus TaxID=259542 RepID=A0AAV3ZGC3_9GAST|nr:hypothetical protein PoB_002019100 [Plakobranchus ocellatus]